MVPHSLLTLERVMFPRTLSLRNSARAIRRIRPFRPFPPCRPTPARARLLLAKSASSGFLSGSRSRSRATRSARRTLILPPTPTPTLLPPPASPRSTAAPLLGRRAQVHALDMMSTRGLPTGSRHRRHHRVRFQLPPYTAARLPSGPARQASHAPAARH